MIPEDKLIASRYSVINESRFAKVAKHSLNRLPNLLAELKGIKSAFKARYNNWLQTNNKKDDLPNKVDFFHEDLTTNKVDEFYVNLVKDFNLDDEGNLAYDEFLADLGEFLTDYVVDFGNIPEGPLDKITMELFDMLDTTQTPYPTVEFANNFIKFIKKYPDFADGSGYTPAIIRYKQWPGSAIKENDQSKRQKLQIMIDKEEQIKRKAEEWVNASYQVRDALDTLYRLSIDPVMKEYFDYVQSKYYDDEDSLTPAEEAFYHNSSGIDENVRDLVRNVGFN